MAHSQHHGVWSRNCSLDEIESLSNRIDRWQQDIWFQPLKVLLEMQEEQRFLALFWLKVIWLNLSLSVNSLTVRSVLFFNVAQISIRDLVVLHDQRVVVEEKAEGAIREHIADAVLAAEVKENTHVNAGIKSKFCLV